MHFPVMFLLLQSWYAYNLSTNVTFTKHKFIKIYTFCLLNSKTQALTFGQVSMCFSFLILFNFIIWCFHLEHYKQNMHHFPRYRRISRMFRYHYNWLSNIQCSKEGLVVSQLWKQNNNICWYTRVILTIWLW